MTTQATAELKESDGPFEIRSVEVMRRLRSAFLALIEAVPGDIRRAADLERALGISTTLAWQIHRVATSTNPLVTGADVPGMAAFGQFQKAARSRGVPQPALQNAFEAMQDMEALVARHAGDRPTFITMMNSLAGCEMETVDLKTRRQLFRLNSQVWGVQTKTLLACGIYHPAGNSKIVDVASVRGAREIRRLRVGAPFRLSSQSLTDSQQKAIESEAIEDEPSSAAHAHVGPDLLLDYCTKPYPQLDNRIDNGIIHTYLRDTPLGNAGVQTLYLADVTRDVEWETGPALAPTWAGQDNGAPHYHLQYFAVMKPAEAIVVDTLYHRDMFGPLSPTVRVFGSLDRLGERYPENFAAEETLPIETSVHHLGAGTSVMTTPHVPRYADMASSVIRRLGWNPDEFDVYRCVLEYPLVSSVICIRIDLPERGNW